MCILDCVSAQSNRSAKKGWPLCVCVPGKWLKPFQRIKEKRTIVPHVHHTRRNHGSQMKSKPRYVVIILMASGLQSIAFSPLCI